MKKTLLITITLCLALAATTVAQTVEELVKQSESLYKAGDTEKFEEVYILLYPAYLKENVPEYGKARQAVAEGQYRQVVEFILELLDEDLLLDEIPADPVFRAMHNTHHWVELMEVVSEKIGRYCNQLRLELKNIQYRDQGIRIMYMFMEDNELKVSVHEYMKKIDNESASAVCGILDRYGWLGSDVIGIEGNETLFLAVQHVDDIRVQQQYLPMLEEAVSKGDAEGWHYAFLTDRILMNQGRKQIYGTQKIVSDDPAKTYIIPLEYPEKVDELRAELGMETLAEDLLEEGMEWDLQKYLERLPEIERMYKERWELSQKQVK